MTVEIRHVRAGSTGVALVNGVDTPAAVGHLCHSLEFGEGIVAPIVVVDLRNVEQPSPLMAAAIHGAQLELQRHHRWLGVVGADSLACERELATYNSREEAVRAGLQYFRLVTGVRAGADVAHATVFAAVAAITEFPRIFVSLFRGLARRVLR